MSTGYEIVNSKAYDWALGVVIDEECCYYAFGSRSLLFQLHRLLGICCFMVLPHLPGGYQDRPI